MLALLCSLSQAMAADVKKKYSIAAALEDPKIVEALPSNVALYWGAQQHPKISKTFGTYKTSKRTNAFGKEDQDACRWALASALIALQERAREEGGNAVVNIQSNIKNFRESSTTEYSCLVGSIMVNVALEGSVVQLAN